MGATPTVAYNTQLLAEDMAAAGWMKKDLAKRARTSAMSVTRFLRGDSQTSTMAKKLASALGFEVRRYLLAASKPESLSNVERRRRDRRHDSPREVRA